MRDVALCTNNVSQDTRQMLILAVFGQLFYSEIFIMCERPKVAMGHLMFFHITRIDVYCSSC